MDEATLAAEDVLVIALTDPRGEALERWEPGAHIDIRLPDGEIRQYSLCGDPDDLGSWRIAVLREENGRGGSRYIHERVVAGTEIAVGQPRNNFPLVDGASYRLLAGGIGLTPFLPMIRELARRGADWRLYYGGRARARMAFLPELADHPDRVHILPEDTHGLLPVAQVVDELDTESRLYCCGPEGLLDAAEKAFAARGVGSLHLERFRPRPQDEDAEQRAFEVLLAGSGRLVKVRAGQSLLDALDRAGLDVPSSCREGTCASCETPVLAGEVDHRDSVLTDDERASNATMMICVSRARSERLTLDL
ncbi:Phenoxybenzoate dioxygenase subunit beta [Frankia canadensis]|uniref:Phenoxybenzoate dioxygenase subunit beta n=1 Tax=Frankia canadensis TaxID=1836972 RepID=A0A2I2KRF6_9ACTN|nr:Phenoxybenzoate dioxygenase subunit beta [Frankia canadensis]SOU55543.1 Phenoxybenzoate dioxygenase subunit beta [Frankia canadensis]